MSSSSPNIQRSTSRNNSTSPGRGVGKGGNRESMSRNAFSPQVASPGLMKPSVNSFASPKSSGAKSPYPTSGGVDLNQINADVEQQQFRRGVQAYADRGSTRNKYDPLKAQMEDVPIDENTSPTRSSRKSDRVRRAGPPKAEPVDEGPDPFVGDYPLQYAMWGHYMTTFVTYLCFFVGVFAILWEEPYEFDCSIDGTSIHQNYLYNETTNPGGCVDKFSPTIHGSYGIGSIYIMYSAFLFVAENRYWGWGLYYRNDSYMFIRGFSPLGICHFCAGAIGLGAYSTVLAAVPLLCTSAVLFLASYRQEAGDGGRLMRKKQREAARKKKQEEDGLEKSEVDQELNFIEYMYTVPMKCYDFILWAVGLAVEKMNPARFWMRLANEEKLSHYFWTIFYIFINLVTFWVVHKEWLDTLEDFKNGLIDGSLDVSSSCDTLECDINRQMVKSGPLSAMAPWAKASAWCLNLNCHLILFPVTKILLAKIYNSGMSWHEAQQKSTFFSKWFAGPMVRYFPLHKNIDFHKLCAGAIAFFTFIHMMSHYGVLYSSGDTALVVFKMYGWSYFAYFSGATLVLCMFFIYSGAFDEVRRAKYEAFFISHHFFVLFFFFLFIHARSFWAWGTWPVMLYMYEKWVSRYRGILPFSLIKVEWVDPVLAIYFRPVLTDSYKFKEGQYLHMNVPAISKTEWHPFTISSAYDDLINGQLIHKASGEAVVEVPRPPANVWPADARWNKYCRVSQDWRPLQINAPHQLLDRSDVEYFDMISLHVKVMGPGSWTRRLKEYYESLNPKLDVDGNPIFPIYFSRIDHRGELTVGRQTGIGGEPLIRVDGPHSAPAEHYHHYKTLMLVGAGIGLTPCASILASLIKYKWKKNHSTEILHFFWVVRYDELDSFQWFIHLLTEISFELKRNKENHQIDKQYYLEINIYITSAPRGLDSDPPPLKPLKRAPKKYSDSYGTPAFSAEQLYSLMKNPKIDSRTQKEQMNSVNTAKNRLQNIWIWNGRPNWEIIFTDMKQQRQHPDIGVAFCGTPVIGNDLKEMCDRHSNRHEDCVFTLHKENF